MRELTDIQLATLESQITKPLYLIELGIGGEVKYYSTNEDVNIGGIDYVGGFIGISSVSNWQEISLDLINSDYQLTSLILAGTWRGGVCKVSWLPAQQEYYFEPGYVVDGYYDINFYGDPVVVLDGELVSSSVSARVTLTGRARGLVNSWTTRQRVAAPTFNHLPAPGSTVTVNGETYTIEASE